MDALLEGLAEYGPVPEYPAEFGARVFKVSRDGQGTRLTHLKVTGGTLHVKDLISSRREGLTGESAWEEKAVSCGFTPGPSSALWRRPRRALYAL